MAKYPWEVETKKNKKYPWEEGYKPAETKIKEKYVPGENPLKPNLAMLNRVTEEDLPKKSTQSPDDFTKDFTARNSGAPLVDNRKTFAESFKEKADDVVGKGAMAGLDLLGRPGNAVVNVLAETGDLKQPEYKNVNGKMIRVRQLKKAPDIGGAFVRGISGKDRPEPLEIGLSKQQIEDMRKASPGITDYANFAVGTVTDPTTYVGAAELKALAKAARVKKGLKAASKIDDAIDVERQIENMIELEKADELLKGSKPIPKFKQYADGSISPQSTYEFVSKPKVYADGSIASSGEIIKKPVINFDSAKPAAKLEKAGDLPKAKGKTAAASIEKPKPVEFSTKFDLSDLSKLPVDETTELPPVTQKIIDGTKKEKLGFKGAWNKFYKTFVDNQAPIGKADELSGRLASNSRNVGGTVDYILKDGLVDKAGKKVGASLREVAEKIPKGQEDTFWEYMLQKHNIDRAAENKNIYPDYTSEMSAEAARRFEAAHPEWKKTADEITAWVDSFMRTWGVDTGIVDDAVYKELRETYKNYIPTQRDFSTLEKSIPDGARKRFVDQASPLNKATGSDRDIVNPLENIMNLVNRTVRTARYNGVGGALLDSVRKAPDKMKKLAEVIPTQEGMLANTDNIVSIMENGKPVYLQINNKELLDSLNGLPKIINNLPKLRKVTGIYKSLITQKNPLFAIRNIFRDVPTSYVYGSTKNPVKFGADLFKAGKDVVTNSENFQRYKAVGGGGANFFKGNDITKTAKELTGKEGAFKKIGKGIEAFNNLTETVPRLAEFNRVLDKTGDVQKALYAANDVSVNFARGGNVTKQLEAGAPYLNASVQGLDKFFRGFKDPKTAVATLAKGGIAISVPEVAFYLMNKDNHDYQALDDRTKDTYFLIPKGDGTFWKIPKSRELGVLFGSLFQRTLRAAGGEEDAFKGFGGTVATNFSPVNPVTDNIISSFAYNLPTNKDFAGRSIVPQNMLSDGRSKYLQYDERTSEISKWIGKLAADATGGEGLSPKQIDYVLRSYTGVIGQLGIPAATKGGDPGKVITSQFTADSLYSNKEVNTFYENLDRLKKKATDKNITEEIPSKTVTQEEKLRNALNKASLEIADLNKKIREAEQQGDKLTIEYYRRKILDIAKQANKMVEYS